MSAPIALQTYTVREALASDFDGVIRQVARMGYAGLETTFTLPGTTLSQAKRLFDELGLVVPSAHVPLPLGQNRMAVLDYVALFGLRYIVSMNGADDFKTIDRIKEVCAQFNEAQSVAVEHGLVLAYHNHWWEFQKVEGRLAFDVMLEHLDPAVAFEVDTYWVKTAGHDPEQVIRRLGSRAPLLHIKDGPAVQDAPMVGVGQGILDFHGIVRAGGEATDWLIVELDRCATDMLHAVDQSYQYLLREALGHGNA